MSEIDDFGTQIARAREDSGPPEQAFSDLLGDRQTAQPGAAQDRGRKDQEDEKYLELGLEDEPKNGCISERTKPRR